MREEEKVVFTISEINNILGALGKIPAEMSMNIILYVKQIVEPQISKNTEIQGELELDNSVSN